MRKFRSNKATKVENPYRGEGLAGDIQAGLLSQREFFVIARQTRPLHIQFVLIALVAGLMTARGLIWGMHWYFVLAVILIHVVGVSGEARNSLDERSGDAFAEVVAYIRKDDPTAFDAEPGMPLTHNKFTAAIKDAGGAPMVPIFYGAILIDVLALIFG